MTKKRSYKKPVVTRVKLDPSISLMLQSPPVNPMMMPIGDGGKGDDNPFASPFGDSPFN